MLRKSTPAPVVAAVTADVTEAGLDDAVVWR